VVLLTQHHARCSTLDDDTLSTDACPAEQSQQLALIGDAEAPKRRKARRPRPTDPLFSTVAFESFGVGDWRELAGRNGAAAGTVTASRIGRIVKELLLHHPGLTAEELTAAYRWHAAKGLSAPCDPPKVVGMVGRWKQETAQARQREQAEDVTALSAVEEEETFVWPEIYVDYRGYYVGEQREAGSDPT